MEVATWEGCDSVSLLESVVLLASPSEAS
jgi:hypothetical protein